MDFKAPWELWNILSNAIPGKCQGSGGFNKRNCLQDRATFHRSRAWQTGLLTLQVFCHFDLVKHVCQRPVSAFLTTAISADSVHWHIYSVDISLPDQTLKILRKNCMPIEVYYLCMILATWINNPMHGNPMHYQFFSVPGWIPSWAD